MSKLLSIKLVGEAPSLLSVNEWILGEAPSLLSVNEWFSGFCSVLLNYGMDKSDSKTVCKSPLMRTWRAGLKPGFFSWLMLVVVWLLNDDLPSVLLFEQRRATLMRVKASPTRRGRLPWLQLLSSSVFQVQQG